MMWFRKKMETHPMTISDQVITALAGYSVLRFSFADRKPTIDYIREMVLPRIAPVIAFQIIDGLPLPISIGGAPPADVEIILAPTGMLYDATGKSWRSIDSWALDCLAAWKNWYETTRPKTAPASRPHVSGDVVLGRFHRARRGDYLIGDCRHATETLSTNHDVDRAGIHERHSPE
jgi:hypothetical protein